MSDSELKIRKKRRFYLNVTLTSSNEIINQKYRSE